jgi:MoaA/NifB/PqqE/SkfB family radical SAM enzyme
MLESIQFAVWQGSNHVAQKASYALDRNLAKPNKVSVLITDACAARCTMCDIWKLQAHNELSIDEWRKTLDELREWLGPFWLVISGGEPFQVPYIFEFLAHCRDIGIRTKLSSNGMFFTERNIERTLEVRPNFLSLSIDTWRKEVHDRHRGVPLYDKCVTAIETLKARDEQIVLGVASIIMDETYPDMPETARWALDDLGVDRVLFQPLYPTFATDEGMDPDWFIRNPHWPADADACAAALEELREMKRLGRAVWNPDEHLVAMQHYFREPSSHPRPDECMVRYNTMNIGPRGDVNFCYTVDNEVGNVRQQHPRDMWRSHLAQTVRDEMRDCKAPCLLNCYRGHSLRDQVAMFRFFLERQGAS